MAVTTGGLHSVAFGPGGSKQVQPAVPVRAKGAPSFQEVLRERLDVPPLRFSAHAEARLRQAGIDLNGAQRMRLQSAVERAAAKGARESLILMDDLALVVSIRNRTVITAVDKTRSRENVFTNIDSTVIV
ncbi:MAG: hypothetical protein H0Z37_02560 [Firmicutes bacterium]|nr:hypothetical protein [Bacillota bacterium]